jgi:Ger(x)C family germination protein
MNRIVILLVTAVLLLLLPGCWDTDKLVNKKIINGISLDAADNGRILGTASTIKLINKGGGQFDEKDEVVQAVGDTVTEIGLLINNMMPGKIEASKTHIVIVGEELAKTGIMAPLEVFYRNAKGNLNASFLIAKGKAADMLAVGKTPTGSPIAFDIMQMIQGAQFAAIAPEQTLYTLWSELLDEDADIVIPIISKRPSNRIVIESVALMDGDKYTGSSLSQNDSKLLLLMMGKLNKTTLLDIPLQQMTDTMIFEVIKATNQLNVRMDDATGRIDCVVKVNLRGDISSYPLTGDVASQMDRLKADVAESLQKHASLVIGKLQAANCDALGIGRRIKMSHPARWKGLDWKTAYPEVRVTAEFKVDFASTGLLH